MFTRFSSMKALCIVAVISCCLLMLFFFYCNSSFGAARSPRRSVSPELNDHIDAEFVADASQLIDFNEFFYFMQVPKCDPRTEALILVHTAPENHVRRRNIRDTWGSADFLDDTPFRLIFLLGAVNNASLQLKLEKENAHSYDMVQGSFQDSYSNMSYKHVMALKWFRHHCSHAHILIKVDDDIFLNTALLMAYRSAANAGSTKPVPSMTDMLFRQPRNLLFCAKRLHEPVLRDPDSKWFMPYNNYTKAHYPPYCPGYFVIYSADVAARLAKASNNATYFYIDDVFVTGFLAQQCKIRITNGAAQLLAQSDVDALLVNNSATRHSQKFIFTNDQLTTRQISNLWRLSLALLYKKPTFS